MAYNKLWYDWKEMRRDGNSLCREIVLDKFDPDVIVGLSRGGLTPGVMMSHWMKKPFKPIKTALRDYPEWEDYLPRKTDKRVLIIELKIILLIQIIAVLLILYILYLGMNRMNLGIPAINSSQRGISSGEIAMFIRFLYRKTWTPNPNRSYRYFILLKISTTNPTPTASMRN